MTFSWRCDSRQGQDTSLPELAFAFVMSAGFYGLGDNLARAFKKWKNVSNQVDDVAKAFVGQADNMLDNAASQVDNILDSVDIHPGRLAAESGEITYESILRALRKSDTPEGYAVAALLKRGKVNLDLSTKASKFAGAQPFGTNDVIIYLQQMSTPQSAAGYVAHEVKHFLQKINKKTYRRFHEFEAYTWQKIVDKSFALRLESEIWEFINSIPFYRTLQP